MRRAALTSLFVLVAASTFAGALVRVDHAIHTGAAHLWLAAGFSFLKVAVAVSFAVFVFGRGPAVARCRMPVAFAACALAIGSPFALAPPTRAAGATIAGEMIAMLGCAFLLRSAASLGRSFSVLPEARRLVTHGPYRYVRHPVYLGELTAFAGLVVASATPRNVLCAAVFALAQATRMRLEEKALASAFPEYADYAARTGRLLPRFSTPVRPRPQEEPA